MTLWKPDTNSYIYHYDYQTSIFGVILCRRRGGIRTLIFALVCHCLLFILKRGVYESHTYKWFVDFQVLFWLIYRHEYSGHEEVPEKKR